MRDDGLRLAIDAAGGIGALARGLGIKQPSVSSWARIPAERVLAVEAVTGVERQKLRPDLYAEMQPNGAGAVGSGKEPYVSDDLEDARAREYLMLAQLLRAAPTAETLEQLGALRGDASPLGMAHIALAEAARAAAAEDAANEFFALFIGIGRGELLPYASYYLTGFLNERPLARVREDLVRLGIERAEAVFEPEDHLGLLFEVMAGFAKGEFAADLPAQKGFFDKHIEPWAPRFFGDLEHAKSARLYRAVAAVGRTFLTIEKEAFALPN